MDEHWLSIIFKLKTLTLENISECDFSLFSSSWKRKGRAITIHLFQWGTTESPSSVQRYWEIFKNEKWNNEKKIQKLT